MSKRVHDLLGLFDPTLPLDRAQTIPSDWYFDPELYTEERKHVFGNTWQMVGRTDQLSLPGSFLTADVAGEPVLVTRDEEASLHAFSNVCRHRAAPVMTEAEGATSRLRCPYHGWTYNLQGRLIGVPEFDGVTDFCRAEHGLPRLALDTFGHFVFVHLDPKPQPLGVSLAPLPRHTAVEQIKSLEFVQRRQYDLDCNWKVFVDNYLDGGYHVPSIHPGLGGVLDHSTYRAEILGENVNVQTSAMRKPDGESADASTASVRTGETAYYVWVFPNFMINLYAGVMDTNLVLPLGPDRCRVIFDFYFAETDGYQAKQFIADSIHVADRIQKEDVRICELVQRGLASRSFDTGRFSVRREIAGYHFHQRLASSLRRCISLKPQQNQ